MVYRVVSTKLSEEEHSKLIDFCNGKGCTPSAFIKESINEMMNTEKPKEIKLIEKPKEEPKSREMSIKELAEKLGVNKIPKERNFP